MFSNRIGAFDFGAAPPTLKSCSISDAHFAPPSSSSNQSEDQARSGIAELVDMFVVPLGPNRQQVADMIERLDCHPDAAEQRCCRLEAAAGHTQGGSHVAFLSCEFSQCAVSADTWAKRFRNLTVSSQGWRRRTSSTFAPLSSSMAFQTAASVPWTVRQRTTQHYISIRLSSSTVGLDSPFATHILDATQQSHDTPDALRRTCWHRTRYSTTALPAVQLRRRLFAPRTTSSRCRTCRISIWRRWRRLSRGRAASWRTTRSQRPQRCRRICTRA